jgi:HlyD family secretion protein
MGKLKSRWFIILFILTTSLPLMTGCNSSADANAESILSTGGNGGDVIDFKFSAEGRVEPHRSVQLSFSQPGMIEQIYLQEGDWIEKDGIIAQLEGQERLSAVISSAELNLLAAQNDLEALIDNAEFQKVSAELALIQAKNEVDQVLDFLEDTEFDPYDPDSYSDLVDVLREAEEELEDAEEDYDFYDGYGEKDESRIERYNILIDARQDYLRAKMDLDYEIGDDEEREILLANTQLALAEIKLEMAQKDYEAVEDGPDPETLAFAEKRVADAEKQLEAAQAALDAIFLKAPFSGEVVKLDMEEGGYVSPGIPIVLLGDQTWWQVETIDLTELDVVDVGVGDPVKVTLDAIPNLELDGEVISIRSYGEQRQGDITYTVVVRLIESSPKLRWNMSAFVIFPK